jgi:rhodanese-related sulfurtransferase
LPAETVLNGRIIQIIDDESNRKRLADDGLTKTRSFEHIQDPERRRIRRQQREEIRYCFRNEIPFPRLFMKRTIHPKELKELLAQKNHVFLIDVRKKTDLESFHYAIPGAVWRNPETVDEWSEELPDGKDVVIYCARGGSVSNKVLDHLRSKKKVVRYIEGGIAAWKASGGTTEYRK